MSKIDQLHERIQRRYEQESLKEIGDFDSKFKEINENSRLGDKLLGLAFLCVAIITIVGLMKDVSYQERISSLEKEIIKSKELISPTIHMPAKLPDIEIIHSQAEKKDEYKI